MQTQEVSARPADAVSGNGRPPRASVEKSSAKPQPRKRRTKRARSKAAGAGAPARVTRSFPAATFEEALTLAKAIQDIAAGQKIRRLTLFDKLGKSPDSGPSRQLVTNSSKYGLTKGSYKAEYIELTPEGRTATSSEVQPQEQLRARFKLAIEGVAPF